MKVTVLVMCLIPHSDCAMPQRVTYKLSIMVAQLPARSSTAVIGRPLPTSLRRRFSAASQVLQSTTPVLPRHRLQTYGRWAFSVAGPSAWNSLLTIWEIRVSPETASADFWKHNWEVYMATELHRTGIAAVLMKKSHVTDIHAWALNEGELDASLSPETASADFWKHNCSLCTEASSALEVLRKCAIQIYYLLTYWGDGLSPSWPGFSSHWEVYMATGLHPTGITSNNRNCCSAHEEVPCYRYTCLSLWMWESLMLVLSSVQVNYACVSNYFICRCLSVWMV